MAFSVGLPLHDSVAEAKIKAAYLNDPGASPNGEYITTSTAINTVKHNAINNTQWINASDSDCLVLIPQDNNFGKLIQKSRFAITFFGI